MCVCTKKNRHILNFIDILKNFFKFRQEKKNNNYVLIFSLLEILKFFHHKFKGQFLSPIFSDFCNQFHSNVTTVSILAQLKRNDENEQKIRIKKHDSKFNCKSVILHFDFS